MLEDVLEGIVEYKRRDLVALARDVRKLWVPRRVPRRPFAEVSALEFVRDYVAMSQPLVFTDLSETDWPCLTRWLDEEYLLRSVGNAIVSVNFTPDGRGDSVDASGRFVKPCEEQISFSEFWSCLARRDHTCGSGVPYLSRQNDSLRDEFTGLLGDIPLVLPIAVSSFGNEPEAINLWIGDERSVSSCHKDHYENLYAVVRGEKIFTLLPPAAIPFLHETHCPPATYQRSEGGSGNLVAVPDSPPALDELGGRNVPWIPFDVSEEQEPGKFVNFTNYGRRLSVEVSVHPGEMLYLPATWYHRVAQKGITIAVNYWHDMRFGHAYIHHQFLRRIVGLESGEGEDSGTDEDGGQPWIQSGL